MNENQQVEWKESWRDEYLKWICGFANAQGGVLEIGRNDRGAPVGLADASKLMEDLPNKVRDILGIIADVDLLEENGHQVLRITVEPYPYPVSYKGQYHYRSGSTKQELNSTDSCWARPASAGIRFLSHVFPSMIWMIGCWPGFAAKPFGDSACPSRS